MVITPTVVGNASKRYVTLGSMTHYLDAANVRTFIDTSKRQPIVLAYFHSTTTFHLYCYNPCLFSLYRTS